DGARAVVDAEIGAAQLLDDEPARAGNPAAELQHRHPGTDAGVTRQREDLSSAHEALLLDELARGVCGDTGSLKRPHERTAVVLSHGCSTTACASIPRRMSARPGKSLR